MYYDNIKILIDYTTKTKNTKYNMKMLVIHKRIHF